MSQTVWIVLLSCLFGVSYAQLGGASVGGGGAAAEGDARANVEYQRRYPNAAAAEAAEKQQAEAGDEIRAVHTSMPPRPMPASGQPRPMAASNQPRPMAANQPRPMAAKDEPMQLPGFLVFSAKENPRFYLTYYRVPWQIAEETFEEGPVYVATSDVDFVLRRETRQVEIEDSEGQQVEEERLLWIAYSKDTVLGYTMADEEEEDGTVGMLPHAEATWMVRSLGSNEMVPATIQTVALTCDDGVQNGDEEGVDCGGEFCARQCNSCTLKPEGLSEKGMSMGECSGGGLKHNERCKIACASSTATMIGGEVLCNDGDLSVSSSCVEAPEWVSIEGNHLIEGDYQLIGTFEKMPVWRSNTAEQRLGYTEILIFGQDPPRWNVLLYTKDGVGSEEGAVVAYKDMADGMTSPWIEEESEDKTPWMVYNEEMANANAQDGSEAAAAEVVNENRSVGANSDSGADTASEDTGDGVYFPDPDVNVVPASCNDEKWNADEEYVDCGGGAVGCRQCNSCDISKLMPNDIAGPGLCEDKNTLKHGRWCAPECADDKVLFGDIWQCLDGEVHGSLECISIPGSIEIENFQGDNSFLNGEYVILYALAIYDYDQLPIYAKYDAESGILYILMYRKDMQGWSIQNSIESRPDVDSIAFAGDRSPNQIPKTPLEIPGDAWKVAQASTTKDLVDQETQTQTQGVEP
eukprot:Filipodium_phascolosomae@DN1582_c0_g1_i1.p1